ncbi:MULTISPECIES: hypothetical protein [Streptomyces]|uniref:Uncharacterized protein n=1 Tax=Streptomyces glycanivorans TaxID=3033808 RepID=A0ABY9JM11_9ACTN|nr:hypothetical protein [Streptomyces sp. Alt3]WLQ68775.1 hypothetical protein P8A20_36925 [Streptomyces sp. Alt3]
MGSSPDSGPKRRQHSTRYAVRATTPVQDRFGVLALISCPSRFAEGH